MDGSSGSCRGVERSLLLKGNKVDQSPFLAFAQKTEASRLEQQMARTEQYLLRSLELCFLNEQVIGIKGRD